MSRPPWWPLLLALSIAVLGGGLVAAARVPGMPTPDQCFAGDLLGGQRPWAAWVSGAAAATAVMLLARVLPCAAGAGAFAAAAAVVLAGGTPWLPAMSPLPEASIWIAGPVAVAVALMALPLLAERGTWSLTLGAVAVSLPLVLAWRDACVAARDAAPVRAAVAAAATLEGDAPQIALLLAEGVDDRTALAISLALHPPLLDRTVGTVAARADTMAAEWLQHTGLPVFRLDPQSCTRVATPRGDAIRTPLRIDATVTRGSDGAVDGLLIRCADAHLGYHAVVYTPAGELVLPFADDGMARAGDEERQRLRGWLQPLAAGTAIRILVVPPSNADAYGWTELRP